jgi:hypothetical protein
MSNSKDRQDVLRHSRECYAHRAAYYDLVVQNPHAPISRETKKELDFVEYVIRTHSARPVKKIADMACGGGRHIVGLAAYIKASWAPHLGQLAVSGLCT